VSRDFSRPEGQMEITDAENADDEIDPPACRDHAAGAVSVWIVKRFNA
jgi:hypothetical protein